MLIFSPFAGFVLFSAYWIFFNSRFRPYHLSFISFIIFLPFCIFVKIYWLILFEEKFSFSITFLLAFLFSFCCCFCNFYHQFFSILRVNNNQNNNAVNGSKSELKIGINYWLEDEALFIITITMIMITILMKLIVLFFRKAEKFRA